MYLEKILPYVGSCSEKIAYKVEAGAIRRFAIASLETDPVYYDEEYAKTTEYGTIIAPPNFYRTFFFPPVLPVEGVILPMKGRIHSSQGFEYFKPMKAGDTVYFQTRLMTAEKKQGKSGVMIFTTVRHEILDENGEPYCYGYHGNVYGETLLNSTDPTRFDTWYPMVPGEEWLKGLPYGGAVSAAAGEEIPAVTFPEITKTWIAQWAGATGDFNPIHLDDAAAVRNGMGGCIAHGMISCTVVGRIFSHWLGKAGKTVGSFTKFARPVKPGDILTLTAVVSTVEDMEKGKKVEWDYTVTNQEGVKVLTGSMTGMLSPKA